VGAGALTWMMEQLLYEVTPFDPMTFVLVGLFFGSVAILACLLPAWRALRVDPMVVLRAE